jgi:hypothetical protein
MLASTIRRLTIYVRTYGFTSERRILQALFPNVNTVRRNAECDSCHGRIGGPRLFCLDCASKSTETYNTLDLCCAPRCIDARITHRQDLEGAHEPSHRLVKVRTTVLSLTTVVYIPRHVMLSNAWQRPAGRLQNSPRIPME